MNLQKYITVSVGNKYIVKYQGFNSYYLCVDSAGNVHACTINLAKEVATTQDAIDLAVCHQSNTLYTKK